MRLIDADEMIKRLQEWNTKDDMDTALFNFALHRILEQPTAYDVDEVVKQLNEKKENLGFIKAITDTSAYIKGINDAIIIFILQYFLCEFIETIISFMKSYTMKNSSYYI